MDWTYRSSPDGNVVQTARLQVDGVESRDATLSLGFAGSADGALQGAGASLAAGFERTQEQYGDGWHDYLASLESPESVGSSGLMKTTYDVSVMALAAHEDKTYRGAFSATPLAWTHAQCVRLAWSIDEGSPVEQPSIVAERYETRDSP